jgi:NhaP-type Na+/H+ or K+/H+ antiporter
MIIRCLISLLIGIIVSILAQCIFKKTNGIVKKLYLVSASVCLIYVLSPYFDNTISIYMRFFLLGVLCGYYYIQRQRKKQNRY